VLLTVGAGVGVGPHGRNGVHGVGVTVGMTVGSNVAVAVGVTVGVGVSVTMGVTFDGGHTHCPQTVKPQGVGVTVGVLVGV